MIVKIVKKYYALKRGIAVFSAPMVLSLVHPSNKTRVVVVDL